jgi:glycosyltransferase involved in cell wall biosynthesis
MKNRSEPISVIIPVYNCERYLAEAIESVLEQTYPPSELIVVDDGSTDGTAAVAARYTRFVRYSYQPNAGVAEALNKGITMSSGSFLSFLDADDIWMQDKLKHQMSAMDAPVLDMVFGQIEQFYSPELNKQGGPAGVMPGYSKGTLLIRRRSFSLVGTFSKGFQLGDFIEWYLRATELGLKSLMLPEVVMRRRIHADNMGIRQRGQRADYLRILKASLDRRRTLRGPADPPQTD